MLISCSSQASKEKIPNQVTNNAQVEVKPDYKRAAMLNAELGIHYIKEGMLDFAKRKILKAQSQDDSLAVVHYAMGFYFQESGNMQQAQKSYEKALSIASNNPTAILYYASFLCAKGQYQQAANYFDQVISLKDNTILGESYQAYALCAKSQLKLAEAKKLFDMALKQNPDLPLSYYQLAQINYLEGNYQKSDQLMRYYQNNYTQTIPSLTLEMNIAEKLGQGGRAASLRLRIASMK
ncbi:tetratricopeptide repeat protein [Thiotrichales bacterium 19S11-10]|nr:tetratricopeptide repeat protein [Thiotrichales bacterium 19S11-10]